MAIRPPCRLLCRPLHFVLLGGLLVGSWTPARAHAAAAKAQAQNEPESDDEQSQEADADANADAAQPASEALEGGEPGKQPAAAAAQEPAADAEAQTAPAEPGGEPGAEAAVTEGAAAEPGDALDEAEVDSRHTVGGQPELTVLPIHNAAGRAFDLAVGRHLMEGLVNVTHLTPLPATRAMVAKMHPRPQDLHLPTTLTALGRRLHAPYVLVVEAVGKARPTHVFIGLVEVKTGTTLLAYRALMPRGVLTAELGLDLAARVRSALRHPGQLRRAAQARDAANAARSRGEQDAAGAQQQVPANAEATDPAAESEQGAADRGKKKKRRSDKSDKSDKDDELEAAPEAKGEGTDAELPRAMLDRARGWVSLQIPQRISRLNVADVDGTTAPCYCGNGGKGNPFFIMFAFGGELYTGAFTGQRRRVADNFGLRLNVGIAPVRSYVKGNTTTTLRSTVVQLDADLLYRFIWMPHRGLSPDLTFGAGVAYYAFPLKAAAYPGVMYLAPDLRMTLNVPVHNTIGFTGSIAIRPAMGVGGDARKQLGMPGKGFGLMLGAGIRGHWSLFEAEVKFRVESYGGNFKGTTKLTNSTTQFQNAKLRDSLKEIVLQVGVAL